MKLLLVATVLTIAASVEAATHCHWGPSYWCKSTTTASECQKTNYCQDNVWKTKVVAKGKSTVGSVECDLCQELVKFMQEELEKNATESEVKQAVENLCSSLPIFQKECSDLVDQYFDEIWEALINKVDPTQVCTQIGLCGNLSLVAMKKPHPLKKKLGTVECKLCEDAFTEVLKVINSSTTEEAAKILVKQVCVYMGGFAKECRHLIDAFWDEIYEDVIKMAGGPDKLCQIIKMCDAKVTSNKFMVKQGLCDICKQAVNFLKPFVDSNTTEKEVKSSLESFCKLLPASMGTDCTSFVDQYFDLAWQIVQGEIDSGEVCKQLGLCNSTISLTLKKRVKSLLSLPKADVCDVCELVNELIKPYIDSSSTEAEVKAAVEEVCKLLPGNASSECAQVMESYFDLGWDIIKQYVDSGELCKMAGLCNSTMTLTLKKKELRVPKATLCDICNLVVGVVKSYVDDNSTEGEVKDALEEVCKLLPGSVSGECTSLVDDYFGMIWQLLKAEVDSGEVCKQIGLCNSTISVTLVKKARFGSGACDACKTIVDVVKSLMGANKSVEELEKEIEKVCPYMVGFSAECKKIIEMNLPSIMKLIEDNMNADEICKELKLCTSSRTLQLAKIPKVSSAKVGGGITCLACEYVLKLVVGELDNNATEQEITAALEKVCDIIPSSFKNECKSFIDTYSAEIIKAILSGAAPKEICTLIQLCTASKQLVMASQGECDVCKIVLGLAKNAIGSKPAESSVEKVLEMVCDLVPKGIKSECIEFIAAFGPELIQLLVQEIKPDVICKEIKLCSTSSLMEPWMKTARKY